MKTLLIINPSSGQHRLEQQSPQASSKMFGVADDVVYTSRAGDAERFAIEATTGGRYGTVIAAGGDGTVNEVVNGILSAPSSRKRPSVGIIPLGTSNILATELGIPSSSLEEAMRIIELGNTRKIDVGSADGRFFTMMASFGADAEAVKRMQPNVKDLVGAPAYILSAISVLAQYRASAVELTIDDEIVLSEAFVIVVANTSSYGIEQVKIAPFAAIDDGWLDICIFEKPPNDRIGFIGQILLLMARRHLGDPRVRYYRAKKITISANPPMLGQMDGDVWRETPSHIEIVPRALAFYVP